MTRKLLPSITLTPEGIEYFSVFFEREFREWHQLGEFSVAVRPGGFWVIYDWFGYFRQYTIVARDQVDRRPLVPPPPGNTHSEDDKEIWISVRRLPIGEDPDALANFSYELNAWRERYGNGKGSPSNDQ